ncbi:NTP transferase domain-containing protein [Candidatus Woesearchaeota archaeon]|nr:NTP transferase domain-containing protein [Candidatus Woesearchaeota archaeon]
MITQAIILAAGKSTRTHPLTVNKPKCLLQVCNKTILEHNLDTLQKLVKEALIVTGFEGHQVTQRIGRKYGGLRISYLEQRQQLGTAHALMAAESKADKRFLVLMGDDLYSRNDILKCARNQNSVLAQKVSDVSQFGSVTHRKGILERIAEKTAIPSEGLANTGCYALGKEVFRAISHVKKSQRDEYELVDAINHLASKSNIKVEISEGWKPVTYPWSVLEANEKMLAKLRPLKKGNVEKGATLKGKISIGKGTVIRAGSYIEGPVAIGEHCTIGPNCYIRGSTAIGNHCLVGNATEIKNSILMNGTHVGHLSYVGDSILGENVNLGAGTITANLRHDNGSVKSSIKGILVDTKRRKLGAIIGDNVHTGIHTTIYPGRKLWPNLSTIPGETVKKDIEQ